MKRVHYRRYTGSKPESVSARYEDTYGANEVQSGEKLIVQGIISGIILVVVMVLCLVDNPRTTEIRTALNNALSGNVTAEQVMSRINGLIGGKPEEELASDSEAQDAAVEQTNEDEGLLNIQNWTAEDTDETKKSSAPEPTVIPEP